VLNIRELTDESCKKLSSLYVEYRIFLFMEPQPSKLDGFLNAELSNDSYDQQLTRETLEYNNNVMKELAAGDHPLNFMDGPIEDHTYHSSSINEKAKKNEKAKDMKKIYSNLLNSDPFWYEQPSILWKQNRLLEFIPNDQMTMIEKLNAVVRFSIYLAFLFVFALQKQQAIWFPLLVMGFTIWFYRDSQHRLDTYLSTNELPKKEYYENYSKTKVYTKPTYDNPMMNINVITDRKDKPAAIPSWNDQSVKDDMDTKLSYNLYRNVSDVWDKETMKRTFYTMPSTTIPNEQTSFAKWCYNVGPTCKEKTAFCASPIWPPGIQQGLLPFTNPT
jgi:Family of unknown function (DUF5762)